ncbi:hypothetical protein KEM55_004299 [Ascosphaera atra]|nr:hypothetical protein KEM55_004299 [Ascosphaera atra]
MSSAPYSFVGKPANPTAATSQAAAAKREKRKKQSEASAARMREINTQKHLRSAPPSQADSPAAPVEGLAAPVDAPLPSVEAGEEPELAAGTEAGDGGRDDESDDDEAASESHSSLAFTAINTPSRPSVGRWAGRNPSPETPLAARRRGDSPPLELAFRYKVRRNGEDESAALLLPVSVVRGKHVVRSSWEKVGDLFKQKREPVFLREDWAWKEDPTRLTGVLAQAGGEVKEAKCKRCTGSGAVFSECVVNRVWGTACVSCLARGGPSCCEFREYPSLNPLSQS